MSLAKILIVEDETIVARDIQQQLRALGYQPVGHATRGEQVMDMVEQLQPDLILMDIQLAGQLDGIAVAQLVRDLAPRPVVFLTAFAADDFLARAKLSEPYGYILKPFSERELKTVLVMALYKFEAERTIRQKTDALQHLSRRVLEIQEAERRRLALELHDELGQALTAIKINLQTRDRLKGVVPPEFDKKNIEIVEETIRQVRSLALNLRPSVLDDLGLGVALEWFAQKSSTPGGLQVSLDTAGVTDRFAPAIEITAFRVVQEAVTNAQRHANATRIGIRMQLESGRLLLEVQDNGRGFNAQLARQNSSTGTSLGLLGMYERAMLIGGSLDVISEPGQGTLVALTCPIEPEKESLL
jgi:signal transduction histidine kinase